jgi:hypothetical protein
MLLSPSLVPHLLHHPEAHALVCSIAAMAHSPERLRQSTAAAITTGGHLSVSPRPNLTLRPTRRDPESMPVLVVSPEAVPSSRNRRRAAVPCPGAIDRWGPTVSGTPLCLIVEPPWAFSWARSGAGQRPSSPVRFRKLFLFLFISQI